MKIDKSIRALPWPEKYESEGMQNFRVSVAVKNAGGEQFLIADFAVNARNAYRYPARDFRLVCSKKQMAARVFTGGKTSGAGKSMTLNAALDVAGVSARAEWGYPEIDEESEKRLRRWLRSGKESGNHYMPELSAWTRRAADAEKERRRKPAGEIGDEDVNLCPEELPDGLVDFIRKTVLPEDDVLIYKKGNVRGTCFRCGQKVRTTRAESFKQHHTAVCPSCGKRVRCFLEGSDRFAADYVEDVATIQRGADGETVFVRQWHLVRDMTAQWADIPAQLEEVARYAVRGTSAARWQREGKQSLYGYSIRYALSAWTRVRDTSRVYDGQYYFFLPDDWREIVAGTSLQYIDFSGYCAVNARELRRNRNPIRFLLDWARYPAIEKLWKAGYRGVVHARIQGPDKKQQHAILWARDSIPAAIRFPARLLKLKTPARWTMDDVQRCRELWALAQAGTLRENDIGDLLALRLELNDIKDALGHSSVQKIARYIDRRCEAEWAERDRRKAEGEQVYSGPLHTPGTYRDYLADCVKLGLDLDDRAVLFPPDLDAAHARTVALVKHKADPAQEQAFAKQAKKLAKWAFDNGALLIRPAASADELVEEGAYLHHCAGGYAVRMAKGETAIFFIRRAGEPDRPFYTLELRDGAVIQCHTAYNRSYENDAMVKSFVDLWMATAVKGKRKKRAERGRCDRRDERAAV